MRIVIQRVKEAKVEVNGVTVGQIPQGLLVFVGVAQADTPLCVDVLVHKVAQLRIFDDALGKMNLSARDVGGQFLVVSQFTLLGNCEKGRRPSFDEAAGSAKGQELYLYFVSQLRATGAVVATGQFGAMMDVSLINDGPVTFVLEK